MQIPHPRPLRGAVCGFGNIGRSLTRFLREHPALGAHVAAAYDPAPAARVAATAEGVAVAATLAELLEARPDFLIIASTSRAHADQVEAAAAAGIHVFCEKPLALTLPDADRAIAAVERAGVVNQVNYSLRYIEAYRTLHDWVKAGRFGRLLGVTHARTRGYGLQSGGARHPAVIAPESSGGWAVHHACHALDLLYWCNGPFQSIYGRTATSVPGTAEEYVEATVNFVNGAIGRVGDSVCAIRDHHTQLVGTAGSAILSGEGDHTVLRFRAEGSAADEIVPVRDAKDHAAAFTQFFGCIRGRTASPHSLREARPSLAAALAIQESARTGLPVELSAATPSRG